METNQINPINIHMTKHRRIAFGRHECRQNKPDIKISSDFHTIEIRLFTDVCPMCHIVPTGETTVLVYICMYVFMLVCMYVCVYVCMFVCMFVCLFKHIFTDVCSRSHCADRRNNSFSHHWIQETQNGGCYENDGGQNIWRCHFSLHNWSSFNQQRTGYVCTGYTTNIVLSANLMETNFLSLTWTEKKILKLKAFHAFKYWFCREKKIPPPLYA